MATREELDEPAIALATERPTLAQRRLALAVLVVIIVTFVVTVTIGLTAPFAREQVRIDGFVPAITAVFFVNDLITATLLFGQFSIVRSRALLALADGYLFTALMAIPFALTFPGAFSPTGLLAAGVQTSAWIYNFWHYGFPLAAIAYAILRGTSRANNSSRGLARSAILWNVAIVISFVCGLTWFATAGQQFLPSLMQDNVNPSRLARIVTSLNTLTCVVALALLYIRRRSVLDLWIMVVLCAWITELALLDVLLFSRFTFGFYAGRGFSLITSIVVLIVLLAETTRLYARLAGANLSLQRERDSRLMNFEAMASSIAHEIRQPLTALMANGHAGSRLIAKARPNIKAVRSVMSDMVANGRRVSEVFDSIRALFGHPDKGKQAIDVNQVALGVLNALQKNFKEHGITTHAELRAELPLVMGNRGQLEEVILNLVSNAIEAMDAVTDRRRVLHVRTERHGNDAIAIAVEDSGPGLNPQLGSSIFDAFVTTKSQGMGLGLTICRMIIERHDGELSMSSGNKGGALFKFVLPIKSPPGSSAGPL